MHDEAFPRRQMGDEIFAAPVEPLDGLFLQPTGEIFRQREPQIRAAQLNAGDNSTLHDGLQAAADGFDFWKFRHVRD